MSRILVLDHSASAEWYATQLGTAGRELVVCHDRGALVEALASRRPDLLVYVIEELETDLALLMRLRQLAPSLPIIVLGEAADLAARRAIQELKPTYYGVLPLDGSELPDAVRGALQRIARS